MGIKLKHLFVVMTVLFLVSCIETETPVQQIESRFGIESIVISGENRAEIRVIPLDDSANLASIEDLNVSIQGPDQSFQLEYLGNFIFKATEAEINIYPDALYRLNISGASSQISAQVETPPAFNAIDSPGNLLLLNPDFPDEILALISWENPGEYLFVLRLDYLGEEPNPIPFDGVSGLFHESFEFPIPENGIPLFADYFSDYGPHRLSIYAVTEEYSSYFYPLNNSLLPVLNSNVSGAFGYMAGATSINFEFDVSN